MAKPKRFDAAAKARRERDAANRQRKREERESLEASNPDDGKAPDVETEPAKPDDAKPDDAPAPPPAEPPPVVEAPPVAKPPPVRIAPPPPVEAPPVVPIRPAPSPGKFADWCEEFGGGKESSNGRRDTCVRLANGWMAGLRAMRDEIRAAGGDVLVDLDSPDLYNAMVLTVDRIAPERVKVTPEARALVSTTIVLAHRFVARKDIAEAKAREERLGGKKPGNVVPLRSVPEAPPPERRETVGESVEPAPAPAVAASSPAPTPAPEPAPVDPPKPRRGPGFNPDDGY